MKLTNVIYMFVSAAVLSFGSLTPHVQAGCDCDINHDGEVDGIDYSTVISAWGTSGGSGGADITGDHFVDSKDLSVVLAGWGACPSPTWATVVEWAPDPEVVTNVDLRAAITALRLPWRVTDTATGIEMLLVPPGTFMMGCSESDLYGCYSDESPIHQVTLTSAFYLGRYEVTQAQWLAEMGSNPSFFVAANGYSDSFDRPVEVVSWNMIQGFNTSTGFRLPTEAEWEYAYRAGTETAFHSMPRHPDGTDDDALLGNIAWYDGNNGAIGSSTYGTKVVGGKSANALGLHDMAGNIYEWCQDWYGTYASGSVTDPTGPATGTVHLIRGGNWYFSSDICRASLRYVATPTRTAGYLGFRVARTP